MKTFKEYIMESDTLKTYTESIAVDLDRTLAYYDGWKGEGHIGEPIPAMLARVRKWIQEGKTIKIFTARATDPKAIPYIEKWLELHGIGGLEVTNIKDNGMREFWDDRAIQIIPNTGKIVR